MMQNNTVNSTTQTRRIDRFLDKCFSPVDIGHLVLFRMAYGITLTYWALYYKKAGLIEFFYVIPKYHFPYRWFTWVQPLSESGMHTVFNAIAILGICVAAGLFYRVTSLLLGLAFTYIFFIDKVYYQNHYYLLSLIGLVLPFLSCGRFFSLDALLKVTRKCAVAAQWELWAVRFLVGVPYFLEGLLKSILIGLLGSRQGWF